MAYADLEAVINRLSSLSAGNNPNPETHKDFYLQVTESVSFIHDLLPVPSRFILVENAETFDSNDKQSYEGDTSTSRFDLTGSPLKDNYRNEDFEITEFISKQTESYRPVNLKNARWLLSSYNRYRGSNCTLPIGIICDGQQENIIFLGGMYRDKELNWKIVTLNSTDEKSRNSLEKLKLKHCFGLKHKKVDKIEVVSSYDLSGSLISEMGNKENIVVINIKWNNCKTISELPPSNASCTLAMKLNSSRHDSIIHSTYNELQILEMLVEGNRNHVIDFTTEERTILQVKNELLDLFQELKKTSIIGMRTKMCSEITDTILPFAKRKREFDITDRIWCILKDYHHMPKLILQCMEVVLNHWKSIQHMLFKDNTTKLVQSLAGGNQACVLNEKLCLEYLLDIGMKKLQRDYTNFIIGSEVATMELIESFLNPTSGCNLIDNLKRLHYAVDLITVCADTFSLSSQQLRLFSRHVLLEMRRKTQFNVIEYAIPTHLVLQLISSDNFIKWQIRLSSDENSYKKETTYQISRSWPNWIQSSEEYCHVICEEFWDRNII